MCTGNTGRSQVAQAFARIEAPAEVELLSAGDEHHIIHPMVHQVAREFELELPEKVPHTLSEIAFALKNGTTVVSLDSWKLDPVRTPAGNYIIADSPEEAVKAAFDAIK